jgi:hypothetical protein
MVVLHPAGRPQLVKQPGRPGPRGRGRIDQLEGDGPVTGEVAREIPGDRPGPAQLALEPVAIGEGRLEVSEAIRGAGGIERPRHVQS